VSLHIDWSLAQGRTVVNIYKYDLDLLSMMFVCITFHSHFLLILAPFFLRMGYVINYVLTMEQNFVSIFLYKSFLKIDMATSAQLIGGRLNLHRITEQKAKFLVCNNLEHCGLLITLYVFLLREWHIQTGLSKCQYIWSHQKQWL